MEPCKVSGPTCSSSRWKTRLHIRKRINGNRFLGTLRTGPTSESQFFSSRSSRLRVQRFCTSSMKSPTHIYLADWVLLLLLVLLCRILFQRKHSQNSQNRRSLLWNLALSAQTVTLLEPFQKPRDAKHNRTALANKLSHSIWLLTIIISLCITSKNEPELNMRIIVRDWSTGCESTGS